MLFIILRVLLINFSLIRGRDWKVSLIAEDEKLLVQVYLIFLSIFGINYLQDLLDLNKILEFHHILFILFETNSKMIQHFEIDYY